MTQAALVARLEELEGSRVTLKFKDGSDMKCSLNFVGEDATQSKGWFVIVDNGMQHTFDVSKIKDISLAG